MNVSLILLYGAGLISFLNLAWYAFKVWSKQAEATSTASWVMWVVLDVVILGSTIATGEPWALASSYVVGAFLVMLVHFKVGVWKWTYLETVSAIGATVATVLWQTQKAEAGVIAGVCAMTAAGIPILVHFCKNPDRRAFPMFAIVVVACILTLITTWPWTIGGSLLAGGGVVYNGIMALLAMRDRRWSKGESIVDLTVTSRQGECVNHHPGRTFTTVNPHWGQGLCRKCHMIRQD